MESSGDDKKTAILEFVDGLRRREWRALCRLLLGLLVPASGVFFQYRSIFGRYEVLAGATLGFLFLFLLLSRL